MDDLSNTLCHFTVIILLLSTTYNLKMNASSLFDNITTQCGAIFNQPVSAENQSE